MGIQDWFSKLRKREDDTAVEHAEEDASGDSLEQRDVWTGDVEGLTADRNAAARYGGSTRDFDR
jgi:hypothetical protein